MLNKYTFFACSLILLLFCLAATDPYDLALGHRNDIEKRLKQANTPEYTFQIVNTFTHPSKSFTEGLLIDNGFLYESTGLYAQSKLRKMDLQNGMILKESNLAAQYFGEGLAIFGNHIYQLTYKEKTGFVYNKETFALEQTFSFAGEGWGLTNDSTQLVMSNGSSILTYLDPKTFKPTRTLTVRDLKQQEMSHLNELEYIKGKIYANVYPSPIVVIITPETGVIEGWINLTTLKNSVNCAHLDCTTNGIAYNDKDDNLYVTGKNWATIYEIKLQTPSNH